MKKFLKWFLIAVSSLVVLILVAALLLPFVLPLDKIKDFVAAKMTETLKREVKIGKVSFNIFTGIGIDDLTIANKAGFSKKPFVKADKIELRYDLMSIFSGKFQINKIALIGPEILLEKKNGKLNIADIIPAPQPKTKKAAPKEAAKKPPIGLDISSFIIRKAALSYIEYSKAGQSKSGFNDLDLSISGITLDFSKPIGFGASANVIYKNKPVPVSASGLAIMDAARDKASILNLKLGAAGDKVTANIYISNLSKNQNIKFDMKSGRINIDKFLAVISGKVAPKKKAPPPPPGTTTRSINDLSASIPAGLKVDGKINLKNITFKEMVLDKLNLSVLLNNKVLKIFSKDTSAYGGVLNASAKVNFNKSGLAYEATEFSVKGFNATPATNAFVKSFLTGMDNYKDMIDKVEGTLTMSAKLSGSGVEMPGILKNAKGPIYFELKDGKLKKLKALEGVGAKIGLPTFQNDMEVKIFKANASFSGGLLRVSSLHADNGEGGDLVVDFKGSLNLIKKKYVPGNVLTLRLSPATAPKELDAFKDSSGWAEVEFELTGSLSKPIPVPKLDKVLEKAKEKAVEEAKEEAKEEVEKKLDELKEDAGEKLKELLNF
jgi:uncharacterized protein involved in outer membrane biogenesis